MDTQGLPSIPRNTRFLEPYLESAGISVKAADDVLLGVVKLTPFHWKAGHFFMDDAYLRAFTTRWLRAWSKGVRIPLEWSSPLIVHVRHFSDQYHQVLRGILLKGLLPPPDLLHQDVIDIEEVDLFVRATPGLLWRRRTADWLAQFLWHLEDPWATFVLGSPRLVRACLRKGRKGALMACLQYAPQYLHLILKNAPPSELYVESKEGLSVLQMTIDQPYLFCELARAGAPREGVRAPLLLAARERVITSYELRLMRGAMGERVPGCLCC